MTANFISTETIMKKPKTAGSNTDPLFVLAGTLGWNAIDIKKHYNISTHVEIRVVKGADVTDIGQRHDDYIGDALLAEFWGNNNE